MTLAVGTPERGLRAFWRRAARLVESPAASPRGLRRRGAPATSLIRLDPMVACAALVVNALALAMPLAVLQVYDRIAPGGAVETLVALCTGLLAVALAEFFLRALQGRMLSLQAASFGHALQTEALRRVLWSAPDGDRASHKDVVERYNAIDRVVDYFAGDGRLAAIELPFAFLFVAMIGVIGGPLVFVTLAMFVIFMVASFVVGRRTQALAAERSSQDAKLSDFTTETLGNVVTVKSFAVEAMMSRRHERLLRSLAALQKALVELTGDAQRLSGFFGNANVVATLGVGVLLMVDGRLTVGGLAACSMLSARAIQPMLRASRAWTETQRAAVAADDVAELFTGATPAISRSRDRRDGAALVEAIDLTAGRDDRVVVDAATFRIESGSLTAFVGRDGSGRSTLLRTAAGLLPPMGGCVLVDGLEARRYREEVEAGVCFVPPDGRLFSGTIIENLTLFGLGPSVADARWAATMVGLEAAVDRLSDGYDTQLAQGVSESLPLGVARTIAIARAIAQRPRALFLDEPNAFLDVEAERFLMRALLELRDEMTIGVITSNADIVRRCDQAYLVADGRVVERAPLSFGSEPAREGPAKRTPSPPAVDPAKEAG